MLRKQYFNRITKIRYFEILSLVSLSKEKKIYLIQITDELSQLPYLNLMK